MPAGTDTAMPLHPNRSQGLTFWEDLTLLFPLH